MKVLHVIDTLHVGGAERVFVDLVNILNKKGIHTEVLLLHNGGTLEASLDAGVVVHKLRRVNKYSLSKAFAAYQLCKQFDIVHVHMRHCYAYMLAVQLAFGGVYKLVLHDHYGDIGINKKVPFALKWPLPPRFYIGVSKELCSWADKHVRPAKQFLLSNVIVPKPALRSKYAVSNRALMVANIRPTKNIEFAIDLSNRLGFELDIYGHNSNEEYYRYLKAKIADNANIRIIEGVSDFSKLYDNYTFALHTAHSETGPLVLLEYMACGIPFVAYKTGEVANIISADLPDLFVDTFEVEKWKEHIDKVKRVSNLPEKLRAAFQSNFGTEKYLKQCLQIYHDVVS